MSNLLHEKGTESFNVARIAEECNEGLGRPKINTLLERWFQMGMRVDHRAWRNPIPPMGRRSVASGGFRKTVNAGELHQTDSG
jgi:hypothetical protein